MPWSFNPTTGKLDIYEETGRWKFNPFTGTFDRTGNGSGWAFNPFTGKLDRLGASPVVAAIFARALNDFTTTSQTSGYPTDWTTLASTSTMPPGGSISRAGNAMLYDATGKLTYAPNNLNTYSNDFSSWGPFSNSGASNPVVTPNYAAGPDSVSGSASRIVMNTGSTAGAISQIAPASTIPVASDNIISIWMRSNTGSSQTVQIVPSSGGAIVVTVTTDWQRFSLKSTSVVGSSTFRLRATNGTTSTVVDIQAAFSQCELVTYQTSPSGTYYLNYPTPNTTSAYYGPRFDYDPVTLAAKGLLVEGTRTNIQPYSSDYTKSDWAKRNGTTINSTTQLTTAPDGTNTAQKVIPLNSGSANGLASETYLYLDGRTVSFYAKAGEITSITMQDGTGTELTANLVTGVITGSAKYTGKSCINVGNNWWRISYCYSDPSLGENFYVNGTSGVNGTNGFYIWGVQNEAGLFPSSYIGNSAAGTLNRAAETFLLTGYANRLVEAYFIDEATGVFSSGNSTVVASGNTTINPPTFGWVTSLRAYTNAYATSPTAATNVAVTRAGGTAGQVPMLYDSTGTLTYAPNNLLFGSQTFDLGYWQNATPNVPTVVQNTTDTTAPNNTNTAAKVTAATGGTGSHLRQFFSGEFFGFYIISFYVKAGNSAQSRVRLFDNALNTVASVLINWSGSAISSLSSVTGTASYLDVGSGWYRVWVKTASLSSNAGLFPSFYPDSSAGTGFVYLWGAQLEAATYASVPSAYIPTTASAIIGPRYDYNPSTVPATALGLLVEGTRTNLLTYSNTFTGAGWTNNASVNVASTTATSSPDGTQNAAIATATVGSGVATVAHSVTTVVASTTYTYSIYVKANVGATAQLRMSDNVTGQIIVTMALSTGACSVSSGPYSNVSASSENVGNGWRRYKVTATQPSGQTAMVVGLYLINNADSLYIFGSQLEQGVFASSYIPTVASTIDRATETLTFANNTNRLVDSFFIDEATGGSYSQNTNASSTSPLSLTAPTFGWSTSLRSYTNAYAGSVSTPSWLSFSGTTGLTAGNRTYYDSTGTLTWAPANLIQQSQTFDSGTWTKVGLNTTGTPAWVDVVTAPDGTTTADKLTESSTLDIHVLYQNIAAIAPDTKTHILSVYAKKDTRDYVTVSATDYSVGSRYACAVFNIATGQVQTTGASGTGYAVLATSIVSVGNGWYRCGVRVSIGTPITFSAFGVGVSKDGVISAGAGGFQSYTGTSPDGLFIWGAQLEPVTYQTAPSAYIPTTSAAVYGPRYDYDPAPVLNYLTYSQDFNNSVWSKYQSTISANAGTAPDGSNSANKLIESTANDQHILNQQPVNNNRINTLSVYAKAAGRNFVRLASFGSAPNNFTMLPSAYFDLVNGVVSSSSQCTALITNVGNGWYRCSISANAAIPSTSAALYFGVYIALSSGNDTYAGDGVSGLLLWGAQLEERALNVTAPSTYYPTTATPYYGPATPRGLLIEEQRQNLSLYSTAIPSWTTQTNISYGTLGVAPDGTSTAQLLRPTTASGIHYVDQAVTYSTATYTYSVFAKASGYNFVRLGMPGYAACFNLSNGTVGATSGSPTASIQSVGNGWYRCSITGAVTGVAGGQPVSINNADSASSLTYTGDGVSGVYVWGAQLEAGAFATSYIPSITGATRAPDVAQLTGSANTTLQTNVYSAAVEFNLYNASAAAAVGGKILGTNVYSAPIIVNTGSQLSALASGAYVYQNATLSSVARAAYSQSTAGRSLTANGAAVGAGTDTNYLSGITYYQLGNNGPVQPASGWYRSLAIYNQRLPDAILKQKSSVGAPY